MFWLGVGILIVSGFTAAYMTGVIPPFLGSIPVRESTGMRVALGAVVGVIVGLALIMVGV